MSTMNQIDRYEVLSECGSGGMAKVYHAYDPDLDQEVAVKLIRATVSDDPQYQDRFRQECRLLANLNHEAIVPILNVGQYADRPYFVMPFMQGGSLKQKLLGGPLAATVALEIIERIAGALDVAHAQGIVHRDIKPHNILFDADDEAYLADFGIARLLDNEATLHTMTMIGTPEYMAPEQVLEGSLSHQTDIYQLGVVLFQMLSGSRPFEGAAHHVMTQHLHAEVPAVSTLNASLPQSIDTVIAKAMAKDSADRYETATQLADALRAAIHPATANAAILGAVASTTPIRSLNPVAWVVGIGSTVVVLIFGATLVFQDVLPREVRGVLDDVTQFIGLNNGRRRADVEIVPVDQIEIAEEAEIAEVEVFELEAVSGEIAFALTPTPIVSPTSQASTPTEVTPTATESVVDGDAMEARIESREDTFAALDGDDEVSPTLVSPTAVPTSVPTEVAPTVTPTVVPTAIPTAEATIVAEAQQNTTVETQNNTNNQSVESQPVQFVGLQEDNQPRSQRGQNNNGQGNGDGNRNGNGDGNGQRPPRGGGRRGGGGGN